jgi:hypothetical protein
VRGGFRYNVGACCRREVGGDRESQDTGLGTRTRRRACRAMAASFPWAPWAVYCLGTGALLGRPCEGDPVVV